MPGRMSLAALAVARTVVSPIEATTAPWLCGASLPVSNESVRSVPDTGPRTRMGSATEGLLSRQACRLAALERPAGSQSATP